MTIEFYFKDVEKKEGTHENNGISITTLEDVWYHVKINLDKIDKEVKNENVDKD